MCTHKGPALRRALDLVERCACAVLKFFSFFLKFLKIFVQEATHFHFAFDLKSHV